MIYHGVYHNTCYLWMEIDLNHSCFAYISKYYADWPDGYRYFMHVKSTKQRFILQKKKKKKKKNLHNITHVSSDIRFNWII